MTILNSPYLRLEDLRQLRRLFFSSRKVIDGRYAGRHASPRRGRSVEFNDYRPYIPGDSPADVDWKVLARTDRYYVRLSEHQSDMSVHLLVDASASMAYAGVLRRVPLAARLPVPSTPGFQKSNATLVAEGTGRQAATPGGGTLTTSKFTHAARIAAAIAFLALQQQDQVSLGLARDGLSTFLPSAGTFRHLQAILTTLENAHPAGASNLAQAIRTLGARIGHRGVVIVLSDLLDEPGPILDALSLLNHRGHEVILLHTLHADEIDLPNLPYAVFIDSETGQRLPTDTPIVRQEYAERFRKFQHAWATSARGRGFDYQLVSTATPYHRALEQYLFARAVSA